MQSSPGPIRDHMESEMSSSVFFAVLCLGVVGASELLVDLCFEPAPAVDGPCALLGMVPSSGCHECWLSVGKVPLGVIHCGWDSHLFKGAAQA